MEHYDGCNKLPTGLTGVSLRNLIINISKAASNGKQKTQRNAWRVSELHNKPNQKIHKKKQLR